MVSILVPSYNQGNFLGETLESLLSVGIHEVLLIDGGSTDLTEKVIEQYKSRLIFWVSEPDRGQSHAINKGLAQAKGEVLNWINSDDYLEPGALKTIAAAFENPQVNVFVGRSNIVQNGKVIRQSRGTDVYKGNLAKTLGQARIDQPEHWWRKSVIDEIGPLNEGLHFTMDRDWWIKYLLRYGLVGIKKENTVLANFRLHGFSKTVSQASAFSEERNSYYRSLALHFGMKDHAKSLEHLSGAGKLPMTDLPETIDEHVLHDAFTHFYLLLADEAYMAGNHPLVKKWLIKTDIEALHEEDQLFADKLRFRSRLPSEIIKWSRKWRG